MSKFKVGVNRAAFISMVLKKPQLLLQEEGVDVMNRETAHER